MNSLAIKNEVSTTSFAFYSADEIRKISQKQITEPETFDILSNPQPGGCYDKSLGTVENRERCIVCNMSHMDCPGHYGHIELPIPAYNPVMFKILHKLAQSTCFNCHHFKHGKSLVDSYIQELSLLYRGEIVKAKHVREAHLIKRGATVRRATSSKEAEDITTKRDDDSSDEESDDEDADRMKDDEDLGSIDIQYSKFLAKGGKVTHFESVRREILRDFMSSGSSSHRPCANCTAYSPAIRNSDAAKSKLFIMPLNAKQKTQNISVNARYNFSSVDEQAEHGTYFPQWELQANMVKLFKNERELLNLLFGTVRPIAAKDGKRVEFVKEVSVEQFFFIVVPVIPNKYRPVNFVNGIASEHGMNVHYKGILRASKQIRKYIESTAEADSAKNLVTHVSDLQMNINNIYDNSRTSLTSGASVPPGIKQVLEKKEGLFRKNMMGKRVNYAARTVISPDISLESNEMGIPQIFAMKLTFPQPVTALNYTEMAAAVINGPNAYPGANFIEDELGNMLSLERETPEKRVALSKTLLTIRPQAPPGAVKKVYRHLVSGDFVLANRQPTLHKPGISGHRAKVLGAVEKTLRMHYCNCSTYNADFDGDEMNIHFPQSFLAQSEVREIAANNFQYLGPRAGVPLRGLIQDHILTGVLLTKRDTLFTRADFQKVLYASCWAVNTSHPIKTPPPCIIKPVPLWSGKQLISAAMDHLTIGYLPLNFTGASKIPAKLWGKHGSDLMRDATVIIKDNEMLVGILDKNHFGATGNGLVHTCYEFYSPNIAGQLLTVLGRMFTNYLSTRGFTCGVDDLLINAKENKFRTETLNKANSEGLEVAARFAEQAKYDKKDNAAFMANALKEEREVARLDSMLKKALNSHTSKIIDTLLPGGQLKAFPDNNFSLMTNSGAKGSVVNFSQVSCLLGQQELEGKRVPRMVSGKTLPSFEPYDASARAGGFIMDRFLTGVRPQDYYFHCMAGREGLIDTAVKTARSGYLQRCIIKHLEGLTVQYDNTVRDSDGSIIQFNYGEDSLEITKRQYLLNFDNIAQNFDLFKSHFREELKDIEKNWNSKETKKILEAHEKIQSKPMDKRDDPVMSRFNANEIGVTSELFMAQLNKYIDENPSGLIKTAKNKTGRIAEKEFRQVMCLNYNRCTVAPGDAVGLLCAQSIGEPSTQMTLNTFHLAGRGEANVTLGIPRLREIIQTASKEPSTPLMEIVLKDPTDKLATEMLAKKIEWLKMCDIIEGVTVHEQLRGVDRCYDIVLTFIPNLKNLLKIKEIGDKQLPDIFESFIKQVQSKVRRANSQKTIDVSQGQKIGSEYGADEAGGLDDDNEPQADGDDQADGDNNDKQKNKKKKQTKRQTREDDDDSASAKQKDNKKERASYDEDDEEKDVNDDDDDESSGVDQSGSDDEDKKKKSKAADSDDEEDRNGVSTTTKIESTTTEFNFSTYTFKISVPSNSKKMLILNIVEQVALNFIIKSFKGISRCFINEKSGSGGKTEYSIQTEGVNFNDLAQIQDSIQMSKLYTNNIAFILEKYGVEACKSAIVSEITTVFGAYGITVDKRHLTMLGDYMTFEGGYRALNRNGLDNNPSPLQKMSFETTCTFLQKAVLLGDSDICESPSSRIVLGQVVRGGTGAFEIVTPLNQ
ncbi:hypothetical protein SAMD00019534_001350 [Acytostelium subglobosum LB1]|uniref:hypothetical protein n=1 Tax=Acytostelium subglobosum LB1 TaxID=1410327 RepID=UPI0006449D5E|nr:hypothetical protein SAMD00019534_001350 [Acytostelium subglobosum LB1]GAM16960.1 hypothetical protein SAMD00019534_001350 [Acytostelium subglobosum LB1]|eukprot:XP_012759022.1 hypothetical protein SAMD00019534_001350 [Acytostelium subglobosum LB1]